ncbi:MAG TPA: formyltransferase family protein [Candidatus Saccharimonadales bacterium]|nr:formyltransferase family protein [Candidatus Saccharimonadales bacterium]
MKKLLHFAGSSLQLLPKRSVKLEETMKKLAILISSAGKGTNLLAILTAIEKKELSAKVAVVICDSNTAPGLTYAKEHHVPTHIFDSKIESLETILTKTYPVDYILLSGWKKIISDKLIQTFPNKILNIHPGLIPDTLDSIVKNPDGTDALWNRGKFTNVAIQNFLDTHATYAGSTLHFLSNEFDFGEVLDRCFEKIRSGDTVESLYTRLKQKENTMYVDILKKLCE